MMRSLSTAVTAWLRLGAAGLLFGLSALPAAADDGALTLYTTREPGLIKPLLEGWTQQSGVQVNTVYIKDGMLERLKAEGANSPADLLMTVDAGNLLDLVEAGVTQPVDSATLTQAIPANLRGADNQWFALSMRARVLYIAKDLPDRTRTLQYQDLAKPEWHNRICMRSGQHPYNTALVAAMIAHQGEAKTEQWLRALKANLARKPTGGDRDVARDILGGICDIGIANSYYVGHLKNAKPGSDARQWGEAIEVIRPTFASGGTHVNISGAAVARHAPNRQAAVQLMEYLVSPEAQQRYARANYEYPVRQGVALDPTIADAIGTITPDPLPLTEIVKHRKQASLLVDKVGFDQ
ncbi:extracellular solute-binding protein [Edwardsiella piscicida]|uniref:extracellular solute-binding protein n=1 Tax=Edwardsiella piscicida TaxID=1263550 RepID=UPI00098FE654|nr:extracellular solute-binding protein [Edwardsiella piscicida]AOP44821.2 extracellular solute-binding protein [Edwardsiella piscicida]EKS7766289.1 extracellular solute-binding protein [Edwardsiella piscicida]EKS7812693.1 extracellular solute-binding protein [Edwardsiella piscicida]ELM3723697.1 extracellular solute-binding protein [Edwardsiella piscicida]UCQ20470.1 extracellular solute-binding protein [Edwardsiella piscicida]